MCRLVTFSYLVLQYYYEPNTGRKFRSRTEVLYYLEHGTSKRGTKKAENTYFNPDVSLHA